LILLLFQRKIVEGQVEDLSVRGIDREGNVANFVETEHVITLYEAGGMKVASYIQTRGSIPALWS